MSDTVDDHNPSSRLVGGMAMGPDLQSQRSI